MGRTGLLAICISAVAFLAYTIMEIYEKIRNEERKRKKAKENVIAIVRAILFVAGVPASVILWVPYYMLIEHEIEEFKNRNMMEGRIGEYIAGLCRLDEIRLAECDEHAATKRAIKAYRRIIARAGEEDEMSAYYRNDYRGLSVLCLMKEVQEDDSIRGSKEDEVVTYCKELLKQRLY